MWARALGWGAALALAALIAGSSAGAGAAPQARTHPAPRMRLVVGGAVSASQSYSLAQLRRLPQTTLNAYQPPGTRPGTHVEQGVSLEDLVDISQPKLPGAKNALLRVTVVVTGPSGFGSSFALGELDPSFGNHPALLVLRQDGASLQDAPELLVPGDHTAARFVRHVTRVTVAVDSPGPSTPPSPGAVTVHAGSRTTVLYPSRLAALPAQTLTVSFGGPSGPQQHTESGPSLSTVLAAAGISPRAVAWVAAVGSDGYVATVTPDESLIAGRPLLLSTHEDGAALSQPRLVADGDVKGGRYVSDVVDLVVGRIPPPRRMIPACARDAGATVNVAHAGSLTNLVRFSLTPAFMPTCGAVVTDTGGPAVGLADAIKARSLSADVFMSADAHVNHTLIGPANGDWARWYLTFARNEEVISYTSKTPFYADLERARLGKIPWYRVLTEPGFVLGRTDPNTDPGGYYSLFVARLAERYYKIPGLAQRLLGSDENPSEVLPPPFTKTGTGAVPDATFGYLSSAIDQGLHYIALPPQINMADPSLAKRYATVSYTNTRNGFTVRGAPIYDSVTVLRRSPNARAAVDFVRLLLSRQGHQFLRFRGFLGSPVLLGGDASALPRELRPFVDGCYERVRCGLRHGRAA